MYVCVCVCVLCVCVCEKPVQDSLLHRIIIVVAHITKFHAMIKEIYNNFFPAFQLCAAMHGR